MAHTYPYPRPSVTVDAVVLTRERPPKVLLIRRAHEPYAGRYALPGGFVEENEDLAPAAVRELEEETGLALGAAKLAQLGTYGTPGRDPRGWTISIAHVAQVDPDATAKVRGADDADEARFIALDEVPKPLAFDHDRILADAIDWLRRRSAAGGALPALLLALALLLARGTLGGGGVALAQEGAGEEPEKPAPRAKPTAEQLQKRLDESKLTVDWKETSCLDAINEVQQKSGVKLFFDQALADFAGKRKVTFDGYSVTAAEALAHVQAAVGFTSQVDEAAGGFKLSLEPSAPTRVALSEKRLKVDWKEVLVSAAIAEIEKKTGLKVQLHETMKGRLARRRITWSADDATAREAIETLYALPPPSVPARLDPQANNVVRIVYDGMAETRADIELFLDEKRLTLSFADLPLFEAASKIGKEAGVLIELDKKLIAEAKHVALPEAGLSPRAALDRMAKEAGFTWKIESGKKVVLRPLEKKDGK